MINKVRITVVLDGSLGIPVRAASRLNCALKNALYCYATYLHAACPFGVPFRSQFCRATSPAPVAFEVHLSSPFRSKRDGVQVQIRPRLCAAVLARIEWLERWSFEHIVDRILGRLFSHLLQICSTLFVVLMPYCSFVLHNRKQVNPLFFNSFFFKVDE